MVAAISGPGLGLINTSPTNLGNQGVDGTAAQGQSGESVYVNSVTGNLILQDSDELLAAMGLDVALVRTYNSLGQFNGGVGDNWRLGVEESLYGLTGTVNSAGSTITKVFGDGAEVTYTFDASQGKYVSPAGAGADDALTYDAASQDWSWVQGAARLTETYDSNGRILSSQDTSGNTVTYGYTGELLTQITDASGQTTFFDYTGANITQIRTVSQGLTQTLVHYAYDSANRLSQVTVDLSPQDNSVADGNTYVTTYTYDGTSNRVASITQSDGTSISFTYEEVDGQFRVKTYTDGLGRTTTLTYTSSTPNPVTANANANALTQAQTNTAALNTADLSTTQTQTTTTTDNLNTAAVSTTQTSTTTTTYNLNSGALTTLGAGWAGPAVLATPSTMVNDPKIGYDANGNAVAIWQSDGNIFAQRFNKASGTWSAPILLDSLTTTTHSPRLAVDASGNAVAAWIQNSGTVATVFVSRFTAATGTWSAATALESSTISVATVEGSLSTAIDGQFASVAWVQSDGTANRLYAVRYNGSSWSAPTLVNANNANAASQPQLAIDASGNTMVLWTQSDGTANSIYANQFSAASQTWGGAGLLESASTPALDPQIGFDANGNGFALWRAGGGVFVRHYSASSNTWAAQVTLTTRTTAVTAPSLSVDAAGDALAAWIQSNGTNTVVWVSRFNATAGTWSTAAAVETSSATLPTATGDVVTGINGNLAVVSWLQSDGTRNNLFAATYNGTAWSSPTLIGSTNGSVAASPSVAIDATGNVGALYQQTDATGRNGIYFNHFSAAGAAWAGSIALPTPSIANVNDPKIGYDANGNAVAIWQSDGNIFAQRFNKASGTWSAPILLDSLTTTTHSPRLAVDASGNAVAAWIQNSGTVATVFVSRFTAATGTWSAATALESSTISVATVEGSLSTAIDGQFASVAWVQSDGTANRLYAVRYNGSSWSAPTLVNANNANAASQPQLAIDASGNTMVLWTQSDGTANSIYANQFSAASQTWGGAGLLESASTPALDPQIGFDANGNGFALWRAGGGVFVRHYSASSNTWAAQVTLTTRTTAVTAPSLSVDAAGDALAAWIQSNGTNTVVWVSRFNATAGTWSTAAAVETSSATLPTATGDVVTGINGNLAVVSWLQSDGTRNNLFAATYNGTAWSSPTLIGSTNGSVAASPSVAIDATGNVGVLWQRSTAALGLIFYQRFTAHGTPSYIVQSGDTWASIAQTLYGSSTAGAQLQTALGNPALTPGAVLAGFPATETVTVTTTITVPPYYTVQSGDTWISIATLLYGDANAAGALQTALGNPPLTAGNQLNNLPATLSVTTTTTVTVPPFYAVQSGDTWQSIALLLYGTSAVAAQLQTAQGNPALTPGTQLTNLPASLTYTVTIGGGNGYTVKTGDTWTSITEAVYATDDANAVAALQAALGNPALTAGAILTMPATLTYAPIGAVLSTQTDIADPLGLVTSFVNDASGRLVDMLSPVVNSVRMDTRFAYGADGKLSQVTQDPNGLDRTTVYQYDTQGNLLLSRDSLGDTVTRTYDAADRLLTQMQYTGVDPDGAGPLLPSGPMTTRYVYDGEERLRFVISAIGDVTEYRYDAAGNRVTTLEYTGAPYDISTLAIDASPSESAVVAWAAAQDLTKLERKDFTYDFRGNISASTAYAATDASGVGISATASVSQYVYDQNGRLLQFIDPRGIGNADPRAFSTSYSYDGLGRVLTQTSWISTGITATTLNQYDAAHNTTSTTLANGLVTTSVRDAAGELISVTRATVAGQQLGTTTYTYDADGRLRTTTDPDGVQQHILYDAAGRTAATVDGNGALTEFVYNAASQIVKTIHYAGLVNAAALADVNGAPASVSLDTLRTQADSNPAADRITRSVYDAAGRLVYSIDDAGAVTENFYDGAARLTDVVQFATTISIAASVGELQVADINATSSGNDRHTRNFYDADGRLTGTLDGEGYLVEYQYDAAGQLVEQIGYATQTSASLRSNGTLQQLQPAADAAHDIVSHFFYDGQGRSAGVLDAEGDLTETVYDAAGNVAETIRYATTVTYSAGATLDSLRPATLGNAQVTSYSYDGLDRVTQQTDFQGTVTQYQYDAVGNLISTTRAVATPDTRTTQARYDALGRVSAQLTAQGSALITGGMTQAQIDAIWAQYSVRYTYDADGYRTSTSDENNLTTYFYYDSDGRQTFAVNAAGDVSETRYDAFGRVTDSIQYVTPISTTGLTGGLAQLSGIASRVQAIANAAHDAHTTSTYGFTALGRTQSTSTAEGQSLTQQDDAFGELLSSSQAISASQSLQHSYAYDHRGLLTETAWDPSGIDTTQSSQYDAFGRVIQSTDANGNTAAFAYDRLGRTVQTTDALSAMSTATYDAFSRVLTTTDALGQITSYVYNDATRAVRVTTPEGVTVSTLDNRLGQTAQITDGNGNTTTYTYDANGDLIGTVDSLGTLSAATFDAAGRLLTSTDARGTVTAYSYDAANRVFTRIVDPSGLALTTTYSYDAAGRTLSTKDANGVVTATQYDRDGRVNSVTVDPSGLALTTLYSYDQRGDVLTVTQGAGSSAVRVTQYVYDTLGRRTQQIVDPGAGHLNLTTNYAYDGDGNVVRKTDADGNATRYVYDADNRLRFSIDALGGVTETDYDADGRAVATRRFATAINLAALPASGAVSVTQLSSLLSVSSQDRIEQSVYDRDGRLVYSVDALGGVTQKQYDANGNVIRQVVFAQTIPQTPYSSVQAVQTALAATIDVPAADREQRTVYDARNQAAFSIDGLGDVTQYAYDGAGNVTSKTAYATARTAEDLPGLATMQDWAAANANASQDQTTRTFYDAAGRAVLFVDAVGDATATQYDALGRVTSTTRYTRTVTLAAGATLAQAQAAISPDSVHDQTTQSLYDAAGRNTQITDAAGNLEKYTYDAVGNRLSFTNQLGAVWTYQYDANGRVIFEHDPAVAVTTVSASGNALVAATNASLGLTTFSQYDALGNITSRTEAFGTAQARTTSYDYDALGRQIRTHFPAMSVYNAAADSASLAGTAVVRAEVTVQPFSQVTYNTLGDAIMNRDVAGNYSYRSYDALGRVTYEVDSDNFVTLHGYDSFGNQTSLTRYATALSNVTAGQPLSAAAVQSELAVSSNDRTIQTTYDRLNRVATVVQPSAFNFEPAAGASGGQTFTAGATTVNLYNALGELVKQSQLVNPLTNTFADTYFYYDQRGLKTAQIDPLGNVTTLQYDAYGNVLQQVQYSKPLAAGSWNLAGFATPTATTATSSPNDPQGYDRTTNYTYDRMNRKITQTLGGLQYSVVSGNAVGTVVSGQTTTYGYDALGNQVEVIDATGASSFLYYDALGREIATVAPARSTGNGGSITPLTLLNRDAFGNLVDQVNAANGANLATATAFHEASPDTFNDRTFLYRTDSYGNVLQSQDPTGANSFFSYTVTGQVAKEWQPIVNDLGQNQTLVTIHDYDALGHEVRTVEPQTLPAGSGDTTPVLIVQTDYTYDAFGEVTQKGVNGGAQEYYEYDRAGRLWNTNPGGVPTVYLYDLAGKATAQITSQQIDLSAVTTPDAAAALTSDVERTETRYDLNGNVVEQRLPQFTPTDPNAGLQEIGAQFQVDNNILGPSNPDAVFSYFGGVSNDFFSLPVTARVNPNLAPSQGGGFFYTPPSASNPSGSWTQDPTYHLVAGRYLHWAEPPSTGSAALSFLGLLNGGLSVVASFQYRPSGNPNGAYSTLRVVSLPNGEFGVDTSSLADGSYDFRVTYARPDALSPYAIATGTMTFNGATVSTTDTTAATLASTGTAPVSIIQSAAVNGQFKNADFRIGDFSNRGIDNYVYQRVVTGALVDYEVNTAATVAQGGGYYLTASGYVQDPNYTPATSRYVFWNQPTDTTLTATFEYRLANAEGGAFTVLPVNALANNQLGAPVGNVAAGTYDYQVLYTASGSNIPVAMATGTFTIAPTTIIDTVGLSNDPPDDAGFVAPISNQGSNEIDASIVQSADVFQFGNGFSLTSTGVNDVLVKFPPVQGPVAVELQYISHPYVVTGSAASSGYGGDVAGVPETLTLYFADASKADQGLHLLWEDPQYTDFLNEQVSLVSGISQITSVRVYRQQNLGQATSGTGQPGLLYATDGNGPTASLMWKAPTTLPPVIAVFQARPQGTSTWVTLPIVLVNGDYTVDTTALGHGTWEYQVTYTRNGAETAHALGTFSIGGTNELTPLRQLQDPMPAPIPPIQTLSSQPAVAYQIGSSAQAGFTGVGAEHVDGFDNDPSISWSGSNTLSATWPPLGSGPIRVDLDYVTASHENFTNTNSANARWQMSGVVAGVAASQSFQFSSAPAGATLQWTDPAGGAGGVSSVTRIRVYTQDAQGNWVLAFDHDGSQLPSGRGLVISSPWDIAHGSVNDGNFVGQFEISPQGANTWTVLDSSSGTVDLSSLAAGNYDYRLVYTLTDANGAQLVPPVTLSQATGVITIPASSTDPITLTQANVVFDQGGSNLPVTVNGTVISWSHAPNPGDTLTVLSRPAGSSTWNANIVPNSPSIADYQVDLGPGAVEFLIEYTASGAGTPYLQATGTMNPAAAPVGDSASGAIGAIQGTDNPPVTATVTSSSTSSFETNPFGFDGNLHPYSDAPTVQDQAFAPFWNGTNTVQMAWAALGSSPVKVVLDYVSIPTAYGFPYANNTSSTQPGQYFEPGWVPGNSLPGVATSQTFVLASASTGATLSWSDPFGSQTGGIDHIQHAQVYTQDAGGNWVLTYDFDGASAAVTSNKKLYWPAPENLGDPNLEQIFKIKPQGSDVWQTLPVFSGATSGVDLTGFGTGNYDFELIDINNGVVTDSSSGTVVINDTAIGGNIQVTQTNLQLLSGSQVGPISASGSTIGWRQAAQAGDSVVVQYRAQGSSTWQTLDVTAQGPSFQADLSAAGTGPIEFQILYTASGASAPYLETDGVLNKPLAEVVTAAPDITATQNDDFITLRPIEGLDSSFGFLSWTTPAPAGATVTFMYQIPDGTWQSFDPIPYGTGFAVDPSVLPPGTYAYKIAYSIPGQITPAYYGSGTFVHARTVSGGSLSLLDTTQFFQTTTLDLNANVPELAQTVDRWGDVLSSTDAVGNTTHYRYNQLGQVVDTQQPLTQVTSTAGGTVTTSSQHPETQNYYDVLGRLIATRDADGNVNSVSYDAAGEIVSQTAADGGIKRFAYNGFGDQVRSLDALNFSTTYMYDNDDRLIEMQRLTVATPGILGNNAVRGGIVPLIFFPGITTRYAYDAAGRRISETDGASETTTYVYDLRGNVVQRITPMGNVTTDTYDTQGNKTQETDADGNTSTWHYDYFGRLQSQVDLGGTSYQFAYDHTGALLQENSSLGESKAYSYDEAGHLTQIMDSGTPTSASTGLIAADRLAEYGYDSAGRQVLERTTVDGLIQQDTTLTYDAEGRLQTAQDPAYQLTYQYDAAGNRTHISGSYFDHTGYLSSNLQTQDLWYTYDAENRVLISQGVNTSGSIAISESQGVSLTYNLDGERASATTWGSKYSGTSGTYSQAPGFTTEAYTYDGLGQLLTTTKDGVMTDSRQYDDAQRQTQEISYTINASRTLDQHVLTSTYDLDGREQSETTSINNVTQSIINYGESFFTPGRTITVINPRTGEEIDKVIPGSWSQGFDSAGNLRGYSVDVYSNGQFQYTTTYGIDYRLGQGYQQTVETASSATWRGGVTLPQSGSTSRTYDVDGFLVSTADSRDPTLDRFFADDTNGNALAVVQGNYDGKSGHLTVAQAFDNALARSTGNSVKSQYFFFANGQSVGGFGQLTDPNGNFKANFDVNFTPISPTYPAAVPASIVTQAGDTLRGLAARLFGDGNLWYLIAQENGLTDPDAQLATGTQLRIPNQVISLKNDSQSFKPFDVSQALGNTTPSQPFPPPPHHSGGCGLLGEILVLVVAIVVTIYTAGAAAEALGAVVDGASSTFATGVGVLSGAATTSEATLGAGSIVAAGAAGAAAGSVASQAVGIAIGQQQNFSWTAVAQAAVGGAVAGGFAALNVAGKLTGALSGLGNAASPYAAASIVAAAENGLTQGIGVVAGLQSQFSWQQVALSAVAAPAAQYVNGQVKDIARSAFAGYVASGITSSLIRTSAGGKLNAQSILSDAFGNAIGESISDAYRPEALNEITVTAQKIPSGPNAASSDQPANGTEPLTLNIDLSQEFQSNLNDLVANLPPPPPVSVVAQSGDSISKIIGTSDPATIGEFMRENGLTSSIIIAGQAYQLPSGDANPGDTALGQSALDTDSSRIRALKAAFDLAGLESVSQGDNNDVNSGGSLSLHEPSTETPDQAQEMPEGLLKDRASLDPTKKLTTEGSLKIYSSEPSQTTIPFVDSLNSPDSRFLVLQSTTNAFKVEETYENGALSAKAGASTDSELIYAEQFFSGSAGNAAVAVRSDVTVATQAGLVIDPAEEKIALQANLTALAVLAQARITGETSVANDFFSVKATGEADLNAGALGGTIEGNISFHDGALQVSASAGAAALVGITGKIGVEIAPSQSLITGLVDAYQDYTTGQSSLIDVLSRPQINPLTQVATRLEQAVDTLQAGIQPKRN